MVRDVGLAEDLAQDALVVALETWPRTGVPDNPGAWLMATAKHRAIDTLRRGATLDRKREQIARELETAAEPDLDAALDDDIGDDLLRLVFTACHPVLPTEGRIALTLRLLGGLTTARSRARSSSRRRRSRSGSRAPSARWPRPACRSRCPPATSASSGWARCSRSST